MARLLIKVLWPSFLVSIVAEGVFFSLFDPGVLQIPLLDTEFTPHAVYTMGFLFFWSCGALSSLLTCYLQRVPGTTPVATPDQTHRQPDSH